MELKSIQRMATRDPRGVVTSPSPQMETSPTTATQQDTSGITSRGLVQIKTPDRVTAEKNGQYVDIGEPELDVDGIRHNYIASQIAQAWERNKIARQPVDRRLLACLRMRKGEYGPDELAAIGRSGANSTIYMKIAATKCRALVAWLKEILLQPGDRPCGLEPRPVPQLPPEIKKLVIAQAVQKARQMMVNAAQSGQGTMTPDEFKAVAMAATDYFETQVKSEYRERSKKAALQMQDVCNQTMDDGGFDAAFAEYLEFFATYPTATLKGPFDHKIRRLKWGPNFQPLVEEVIVKSWRAVNPFDCYPAPMAKSSQERDFIERLRIPQSELYNMIGLPDYDEQAIRWVLDNKERGLLRNWIWTDSERALLENDTTFNWFAQDDLIDALHYWGSVDGTKLLMWGVKGDIDPQRRYEVDAIMIGSRIISCCINRDPLGRRPYREASFEHIPGSYWGRGVPELCESAQDMCNAAARAISNNAGIASGPMMGINVDRMPPGENLTHMYPWKIFQFNRDDTGGSGTANAPLQFFQADMVVDKLLAIFEKFDQRSDDDTGIPRYTYGDEKMQGAAATLGGLQMLMNAAAKGVRRAISEIDMKVLAETYYDVFVHCMIHVADPQIKGDCVVVPRGSAALLIKDQAQQGRQMALGYLAQTPIAMQLVGMKRYADILREFLKGLHLPADSVPDGPELEEVIKSIQDAQARQQDPAMVQAQATMAVEQNKTQSAERIAGANIAKDVALHHSEQRAELAQQAQAAPTVANKSQGVGKRSGLSATAAA